MRKHNKLFTVSVATQPHCQLHPPPLLMTLHVSEVKNRRNTQMKTVKAFSEKEREPTVCQTAYLLPCDSSPVQNG